MCSIIWSWQPATAVAGYQTALLIFYWNVQTHPHSCLHNPTFPHLIETIKTLLLTTAIKWPTSDLTDFLQQAASSRRCFASAYSLLELVNQHFFKILMGSLGSTNPNVVVFRVVWFKKMQSASSMKQPWWIFMCAIYSLTLLYFVLSLV